MIIGPDTPVTELLKDESIREKFKTLKLRCAGCRGAVQDTLKHVARNNGYKIDELISLLSSR